MTTKKWYEAHKEEHKKNVRRWYEENREHKIQMGQDRALEKKLVVLDYYSNGELKCAHCGIDDLDVLTLDHIHGGGTQHRKLNPHSYRWAINNDFPEGFQVLCFNCNWKKRIDSQPQTQK